MSDPGLRFIEIRGSRACIDIHGPPLAGVNDDRIACDAANDAVDFVLTGGQRKTHVGTRRAGAFAAVLLKLKIASDWLAAT